MQTLIVQDSFRYASGPEVLSMIHTYFGYPVTSYPGDAAGYEAAQNFFDIFGVNESGTCGNKVPCPRTQGLTSTPPPPATTTQSA